MTEKILKHISEKDTSGMDMKIADLEINGRDGLQTYLFEFGDNGTIHSAAFGGRLEQGNVDGLFEFLHTRLYQDCPEAVRSYLEQHHLKYTSFNTGRTSMAHDRIMRRAGMLLGCCSCDIVDTHIGSADYYYGIMDYQKWLDENRCEGCYYAMKRTRNREAYSYRIVGQTFFCKGDSCLQEGHFAVRTDGGDRKLYSLAETHGESVLPAAGCVNVLGILAGIDGIHTALQAFDTAVR